MNSDPDHSTDDYDAPFADLEPYPSQPAEWDDAGPTDDHDCPVSSWPLLLLAVAAVCGFAVAAKLVVEAR